MLSRLRCGLFWFALALALFCLAFKALAQAPAEIDWPTYGNDPGGMRYSSASQIDTSNVSRLTVAWTLHTGDISNGSGGRPRSGLETTPLMIDGTLYLTT